MATGETKGNAIAPMLIGPLTGDIMRHPVTTSSGHTYEEEQIRRWFAQGNTTDPVTGEEIDPTRLFPNKTVQQISATYFADVFSFRDIDGSRVLLPPIKKLHYASASTEQRAEAIPFFQADRTWRRQCKLGSGNDKTAYFGWYNEMDVAILHYKRSRETAIDPEVDAFKELGGQAHLIGFYGIVRHEGDTCIIVEVAEHGSGEGEGKALLRVEEVCDRVLRLA